MGIFGTSSPFDQDVERATSETSTSEEWGLILEICDRAGASAAAARDCLRAVLRRLAHADPHVQVHAATLLDACVANCGRAFHLEVASRDFEAEFRRLLARAQPPVRARLRALLRKWADGEFRDDPQLDLIPSLHAKLAAEDGAAPAAPVPAAPAAAERREQEELERARRRPSLAHRARALRLRGGRGQRADVRRRRAGARDGVQRPQLVEGAHGARGGAVPRQLRDGGAERAGRRRAAGPQRDVRGAGARARRHRRGGRGRGAGRAARGGPGGARRGRAGGAGGARGGRGPAGGRGAGARRPAARAPHAAQRRPGGRAQPVPRADARAAARRVRARRAALPAARRDAARGAAARRVAARRAAARRRAARRAAARRDAARRAAAQVLSVARPPRRPAAPSPRVLYSQEC